MPLAGFLGYAAAALAWAALACLLAVRGGASGPGRGLVAAAALQASWGAAMAASLTGAAPPAALTLAAEAMRPMAWSMLLIAMLRDGSNGRAIVAGLGLALAVALAQFVAAMADLDPQLRFGTGLLAGVLCLLCVEQVYRNTPEAGRWAVKFLCLALAALSVFDVVLYADALLYGRFEYAWWAARGWAHALMVPLVAVTAARVRDWRLDIHVSRKVVFHSATLLASGIFLLAVAAIGYGLRVLGGAWTGVAQTLVVFTALVALVALVASERLRARLRVLLAKHFFSYRYDYRTEWLKLTELLAQPEQPGDPAGTLSQRALRGLAGLVESPGGALWLRADDGGLVCQARTGVAEREPIAADEPLVAFVAARDWIVDVPEWRAHPGRYDDLVLPHWLVSDPDAWLVVPLALQGRTIGLVQLQRPVVPVPLDWEVRDVLKTAGRQVAGYLAVRQAVEKLVQARQFDSFNRMSAFVVHDLKNLVAQLSLLLRNAARHRDNPQFQQDMLETVENVLGRMQGLLMQLRAGTRPIEPPAPVALAAALRGALAAKKGSHLEPRLELDAEAERIEVVAHRDRLERVVGHLVQNAIEATPAGGSVRVGARVDGADAVVEVADTGRGMSRSFVDTELFRPFTSTKEHGMGIGAFESREYVQEIGGTLSVRSAEGRGTTFTIRLPARPPAASPAMERR